jgi:uncharacterized membrane protein YsdA (DUF1294 family)/cold shock CspA family protein
MRKAGQVVRFDAARGFGFIRCADSEADVFFHVRDFAGGGEPPVEGLAVVYEEIHVGGKGPRGMAVRPAHVARQGTGTSRAPLQARRLPASSPHARAAEGGIAWMLLLIGLYVGVLAWAGMHQRLPVSLLLALPVVNVLSFIVYWKDKHAARQRAWRTSESTLHGLSLLGGWPAAWFAQQVLRHKSRKPSFRQTYWMTVVAHGAALVAWLWGAPLMRTLAV